MVTGALGAGAGVWLGGRMIRKHGLRASVTSNQRASNGLNWIALGFALLWVGVLMVVFWYPFNFHTDSAFIRERLGFLAKVPFETYYYGTEFRAVTEVFHKLLFFAPLGMSLAWFVAGLSWRWRSVAGSMAFMALLAVPLGIECGQVMLPDKFADTTDLFLEGLGGWVGYVLVRVLKVRMSSRSHGENAGLHHRRERPRVL